MSWSAGYRRLDGELGSGAAALVISLIHRARSRAGRNLVRMYDPDAGMAEGLNIEIDQ